jgi:pyridoxal phosphate phosphatase PHOSPHO2
MQRAIRDLKARGPSSTLLLLSNSNSVFIDVILRHHNLDAGQIFEEIVTNPAEWDESGCLRLRRLVDPNGPPHGCADCPLNMCKGKELDEFLAKRGGMDQFDQIFYIGDGANDLCPITRLRKDDFALVRVNRDLHRIVKSEEGASRLKCGIHYWSGAWEVERFFSQFSSTKNGA